MFIKLWRLLRRQKRSVQMLGPAGTGKTMTLPRMGEGQLGIPMSDWLPYLWWFMAESAARRGYKPIVFIDEKGLDEIPLPPHDDNAPQK